MECVFQNPSYCSISNAKLCAMPSDRFPRGLPNLTRVQTRSTFSGIRTVFLSFLLPFLRPEMEDVLKFLIQLQIACFLRTNSAQRRIENIDITKVCNFFFLPVHKNTWFLLDRFCSTVRQKITNCFYFDAREKRNACALLLSN